MNVVGKVGSLISQGVYSVATPFHPFGGAVDVIVVQQQDGTFRSTPWYVRFGKFQGVLKGAEKVVRISVNGVESNFHMYLDNSGEAYFVKDADEDKGVDLDQDSSSKSDNFLSNGHRLDHSISDSGVLRLKDEEDSSVGPRIQRTESDGRYYDFQDSFDDLSEYGSNSYGTLDGENSVDLQGSHPEMVLVSVDGHILTAPISESEQNEENVQLRNPQFHLGPAEETDICEGNGEFSSGETAWAADYISKLGASTTDIKPRQCDTNTNGYGSTALAPLKVCQEEEVNICQSQKSLEVEIQEDLLQQAGNAEVRDASSSLEVQNSSHESNASSPVVDENELESIVQSNASSPAVDENDQESIAQSNASSPVVYENEQESIVQFNASSPVVDENEQESIVQSNASCPAVDENEQESVVQSTNIDELSSTSSPTSFGGHKSPTSESGLQDQEADKDSSREVVTASGSPITDDTEWNNKQADMSVSNDGVDETHQTTSVEDNKNNNSSEVVKPQAETSSKGDQIHPGLGKPCAEKLFLLDSVITCLIIAHLVLLYIHLIISRIGDLPLWS